MFSLFKKKNQIDVHKSEEYNYSYYPYIPTDIKFYENYKNREAEFEKKFNLVKKHISEAQFKYSKHYYALGLLGNLKS